MTCDFDNADEISRRASISIYLSEETERGVMEIECCSRENRIMKFDISSTVNDESVSEK